MEQPVKHEKWTARGAVVVKVGALLSVLSIIAVVGTHFPTHDAAGAAAPPAAVSSSPAQVDVPYYFPSQYKLNAPEPGEPVPTF